MAMLPIPLPEIPQWAWPAEPVRYHLETLIVSPKGHVYLATDNLEEEAAAVRVRADVECQGVFDLVWEVRCSFHYLKIDGDALHENERAEGRLDEVLEQWTERLEQVDVVFRQGVDGGLRQFDLEGYRSVSMRDELVLQTQRMLMQRTFCLFDAPLRATPEAFRRGWTDRDAGALLMLQGLTGTVGAATVVVRPVRAEDGGYTIAYAGRAVLAQGAGIDQGNIDMQQEGPPPSRTMFVDTSVGSTLVWDAGAGVPTWRDLRIEGRHTASSLEWGSPIHMQQLSGMQRVAEFGVNGEPPPALSALKAPKLRQEPAPPEGPLVPFAELGMQALTLPVMPDAGRALSLPPSTVKARVWVGPGGKVRRVEVYEGFAALEPAVSGGLRAVDFPDREGKPYAVDVEVWVGG